jgi:PAS domain S-box-containing protein
MNTEGAQDQFFDLSSDLLCAIGLNSRFSRVNSSWEKTLGYCPEELISQSFFDFLHPDDRKHNCAEWEKIVNGAEIPPAFQNRFVAKKGSVVLLTWTGVISRSTFYGIARNTTLETLEKKAHENQSAWLGDLIRALPIPLALVEASTGKILSMSLKNEALMDGMPLELPTDDLNESYYFSDSSGKRLSVKDWPRSRTMRGEFLDGEQLSWHTPHRASHLMIWTRIIPAKYDHPEMMAVLLQNIDPLKEKEAALNEAVQKLNHQRKLREDFVAALSHDLRTPLTSARLGVQLLARTGKDPIVLQKNTGKILKNIDRMDTMIRDLLDANSIRAGEKVSLKKARLNLNRLISLTLEGLSAVHGKRFKLIENDSISGNWSKAHLRRVIENLVNNAVKYGSKNTPITITLQKLDLNTISIAVHNSGNPIPLAEQSTLFEQFRRTQSAVASNKHGWGVGLTLVKGIVEAHAGKLTVHSSQSEGTTFT